MRHSATRNLSRRSTVAVVGTGLVGSVALVLSMGASLSGYTANIANTGNTAASAALAVTETSGSAAGVTCNSYDSTASCGNINKYGGTASPMIPGGSQTTTVKFANTGTVGVGSATMKGGACLATKRDVVGATTPSATVTDASNLCSVLTVDVYKGGAASGNAIYSGTLAAFQGATATALEPIAIGASQEYTFKVSMPIGATTVVQGQMVSQPITWTFNQ